MADDRAVSDVLAFVLIFGVMVTSVGLIAVVGFDAVEGMSDGEQLQSAEVSMAELADQMTGIADHEAPVRSTEFRMRGATTRVIDSPTLNVTITSEGGDEWNASISLGGVAYELGDSTIAVVGGSVVRVDGTHAVMLREPPFMHVDDRARLNLIQVRMLRTSGAITTDSTVQLRSHHDRTRLITPDNRSQLRDVVAIHIDVVGDDPIAEVWDGYFDDHPAWSDGPDGWVADDLDNGAIVRLTWVDVQFIR